MEHTRMENTKSIIDNIKNDVELKQLKEENELLKDKINALRSDNNSFLYAALVKAQAEMPVADKNSTLADVVRISRPILVKNGLAVTQMFLNDILITRLVHSSGQFIESSFRLVINSKYVYSSIIGLVTSEDADGN